MKQYTGKDGYLYCNLKDVIGRTKRKYVHEMVAEAFVPNPEKLKYVRHIDGNIKNNCADNLAWSNESPHPPQSL